RPRSIWRGARMSALQRVRDERQRRERGAGLLRFARVFSRRVLRRERLVRVEARPAVVRDRFGVGLLRLGRGTGGAGGARPDREQGRERYGGDRAGQRAAALGTLVVHGRT